MEHGDYPLRAVGRHRRSTALHSALACHESIEPLCVNCVRETEILVEQQPPHVFFVSDHSGRAINEFSDAPRVSREAAWSVAMALCARSGATGIITPRWRDETRPCFKSDFAGFRVYFGRGAYTL